MKRAILFLLFCIATRPAFGQGARFGDSNPVQQGKNIPGQTGVFVIEVASPQINFCNAPANAVPCTNKATTYTDSTLTTPCSTSTQIVLAGTSTCVGLPDQFGNWGVWAAPGQYQYTITVNGASTGPFYATLSPPGGGPATFGNINGALYVGSGTGQYATLQAALTACPAGTGGCLIYVTIPLTYTAPITWSQADDPLTIDCRYGADVNLNPGGLLITYSPTGTGTNAFTVTEHAPVRIIGCNFTQGNSQASTNGIVFTAAQGSSLEHVQVYNFTGSQWDITDATGVSGIKNACYMSQFYTNTQGLYALRLLQSAASQVVNQNLFYNCSFQSLFSGSTNSIKMDGNTSENGFYGGDITGVAAILVQLGFTNGSTCRDNYFSDITMEAPGSPPSNQIGFDNNGCLQSVFYVEGGLTGGGTPVTVNNHNSGTYELRQGACNGPGGAKNEIVWPGFTWAGSYTAACAGISTSGGLGLGPGITIAQLQGAGSIVGTGSSGLTLCNGSGCPLLITGSGILGNGALRTFGSSANASAFLSLFLAKPTGTNGTVQLIPQDSSGTNVGTIPANTGTFAETNLVETWSAAQTFNASSFLLNPGPLTFVSLGSAARNTTFPDNTGTVAELNLAQSWTAAQTLGAGGSLNATSLLISPTAPTIAGAGCGGSAASISNSNGTAAFEVNVGTAPGSACTITMPAAAHKWICNATDFTTNSTTVFYQKQSPVASQTTTQIVITNFSDVAAASAFTASDLMGVSCHAY